MFNLGLYCQGLGTELDYGNAMSPFSSVATCLQGMTQILACCMVREISKHRYHSCQHVILGVRCVAYNPDSIFCLNGGIVFVEDCGWT